MSGPTVGRASGSLKNSKRGNAAVVSPVTSSDLSLSVNYCPFSASPVEPA